MNVLVLSAHPDDETLGCGGTIKRLADEGANIHLITFTDGEGARGINKNRNIVLGKVCKMLGIRSFISGNFPDNKMASVPLLDLCKFIEKNKGKEPDIIFTHHRNCLNVDHSMVYKATITAFRPQFGKKHIIYSYYVPSSTDYNPFNDFKGNIFFNIKDQLSTKLECLKIYDDEMRKYPHTRSYKNIENLAYVNGSKVGLLCAESFELVRSVI